MKIHVQKKQVVCFMSMNILISIQCTSWDEISKSDCICLNVGLF